MSDIEKQRQRLISHLENYVKESPDIMVFPELFLSGYYFDKESIREKVRKQEGIFTLGEIAQTHNCFALGGIITIKEENYYNSAVVVSPNAEIHLNYRKVHLYKDFQEDQHFIPGSDVCTFNLPLTESSSGKDSLRCMALVCFDLVMTKRDPAWMDKIKEKNPEIIFVVAQWPKDEEGVKDQGIRSWKVLNSRLSRELGCPVIGVNRYGPGKDLKDMGEIYFAGHSGYFDYSQSHTPVENAGEGEKICELEVELKKQ
jgi:predicted amidohydrolase